MICYNYCYLLLRIWKWQRNHVGICKFFLKCIFKKCLIISKSTHSTLYRNNFISTNNVQPIAHACEITHTRTRKINLIHVFPSGFSSIPHAMFSSSSIQIPLWKVAARDLYINMVARARFSLMYCRHYVSSRVNTKNRSMPIRSRAEFQRCLFRIFTAQGERKPGLKAWGSFRGRGNVCTWPCLPGWNVTWSITSSWKLGPKRRRVRGFGLARQRFSTRKRTVWSSRSRWQIARQ